MLKDRPHLSVVQVSQTCLGSVSHSDSSSEGEFADVSPRCSMRPWQ